MKEEGQERLTFRDLYQLIKRSWYKVAAVFLLGALIGIILALHRPIYYQASGTFKDSGKVRTGINDPFASLTSVAGMAMNECAAIPLLKSRKIIGEVVEKLGLQAAVLPPPSAWPLWSNFVGEIEQMGHNVKIELALWRQSKQPALPPLAYPLICNDINYAGEVPLKLNIILTQQGHFSVWEGEEQLGQGQLGQPFSCLVCQFCLKANPESMVLPPSDMPFTLLLQPKAAVVEAMTAALTVENDRFGKNILWLRFAHRDRSVATAFINALMESYRRYNIEDDKHIMLEQIAYLHQRQTELGQQLQAVLQAHAGRCSEDLAGTGFPDVESEMSFFVSNHQDYHRKLFSIELEKARLQKYLDEGLVYYERYATEGDPLIINKLLEEMRELKQQSDTLELALARIPVSDAKQLQEGLSKQLSELEETRNAITAIASLSSSVEKGFLATSSIPENLLNHPRYLIAMWMQRLQESQQHWLVAPPAEKGRFLIEWEQCKASFINYLNNLQRLLQVYANNMEERISRHQDLPVEMQGLDLKAAWQLYNGYIEKLNELEAQLLQGEFIAEQIQESSFEVSSLSSVLNDNVSQELFAKASRLTLELRDESNRNQKEIWRIKEELSLQKEFLIVHLRQTIVLWELNQKSMIEKIHSVQGLLRDLIQMRLTVLQQHLEEYVHSRLSNLEQEQMIIQQRQGSLRLQMSHLPLKLIEKKLIEHQISLNRMMIEEMMRLVEAKNISSHLEMIQSAPLDAALAPIHPRSCHLLFFSLGGGLLSASMMAAFLLTRQLIQGMPATAKMLQQRGAQIIYGKAAKQKLCLASCTKEQLDLLRTTLHYCCQTEAQNPLLIVEGAPPIALAMPLAELLAMRGESLLLVQLDLSSQELGLGAYLEGQSPKPNVQKTSKGYDLVSFGAASPLGQELLLNERFTQWLTHQRAEYKHIICSIALPYDDSLALSLAQSFNFNLVVIDSTATMEKMHPWLIEPMVNKSCFLLRDA